MKRLGEMWGALSDAQKNQYIDDAPLVEAKPKKRKAPTGDNPTGRPSGSAYHVRPSQGPSPCKFGDRCRFFARGCCRNYHPQVPIEPLGDHNWYY